MASEFNWNQFIPGSEEKPQATVPDAPPVTPTTGVPPAPVESLVYNFADEHASTTPQPVSEPLAPLPVAKTPLQEEANRLLQDLDRVDKSDHEAMMSNYKPIAVDPSVHKIDVSDHRYDQVEPLGPMMEVSDAKPIEDVHLDDVLRMALERKASDIHLTVGLPPMVRQDGELVPLPYSVLTAEDTRRLIYEILSDESIQKFEQTHELDCAYSIKNTARFRLNVYVQRGSVAAAMRTIPTKIPSFESLGLPPIIREISKRISGLVLVTGPTGSGKSTTIATMIDDINRNRDGHIITMEDPIEYLHNHNKCMVNQRELHADTFSFHAALRAVLREDPDIILVGELRDLETIEAALTLAETGHLVFGTLHTRNAPATIDRIIDVFPSDQQDQIRVLLGNTLEGVVSQQLLPRLGGGRVAAIEIMIGTPAIKNLIREGKTHQMYSIIETNANVGMQTMDSSLAHHYKNGNVSYDEALMRAVDRETFARLAKGM
jgi:twitching motility protein PilT